MFTLVAACRPSLTRAESPPDVVETITDDEPQSGGESADGDMVEAIGEELSAPPPPAAPALASPSADRFELHGWARQSAEWGFARDRAYASAPDPRAVPYNSLVARTQLLLRARYSHAGWFEADVSGVLRYGWFGEGPSRPELDFVGWNGQAQHAVLESQLRELYVGLFAGPLDVRIGQQRVAWGRGEFISPNDVLNARDMRDPLIGEPELRVQPTPMLRADLDLGFGSLQGIASPVFVPDRIDVYGANWAAIQPVVPESVRGFFGVLTRPIDPTQREPLQRLLQATRLPAADLTQPSLGARFAWSAGGIDVSHYYHYGFDGPFVSVNAQVLAALQAIDFSRASLSDFDPLLTLLDRGTLPFEATYVRRHHVGFDLTTTLGPFAVRLDAAYQSRRVFYQRNLLSTTSPIVQGVLGVEYQTGNIAKTVLVEGMYMRLLETPKTPLLIWDLNNIGVAGLLRWTLFGPFGIELRSMLGIIPLTQVVQGQLDAKFGAWIVSAGGLWLHGEPYSFGDFFHRNSAVFGKLRVLL